jgi:hypothetical protein
MENRIQTESLRLCLNRLLLFDNRNGESKVYKIPI